MNRTVGQVERYVKVIILHVLLLLFIPYFRALPLLSIILSPSLNISYKGAFKYKLAYTFL